MWLLFLFFFFVIRGGKEIRSEAKQPVSDNDIAVSYIPGREKIALQRKAAN